MQEINLYDLLRYYAKNWYNILSLILVGAIIGVLYTFYIQTPLYESKATLLAIGTQRTTSGQDSVTLNNYVSLFKSHRVLDGVITKQKYDKSFDELVGNTTAQNDKNTDIIRVSIATPDAEKSKKLLESAIESFRTQAKDLYGKGTLEIKVVDAADTPEKSSNVKPVIQITMTTIAGFVFALVMLFFIYDFKHNRRQEIRAAQAMKDENPVPMTPPVAPIATQPTVTEDTIPAVVDEPQNDTSDTLVHATSTPSIESIDPTGKRHKRMKRMMKLLIGDGESNQRKQ
mgnify:CR=1 FL=1